MRRKVVVALLIPVLVIAMLTLAFVLPVLSLADGFANAVEQKDTESIHTYFTDNCAIRTNTDSKAFGTTIGDLVLDAVYNNNPKSMEMALELYNRIGLSDNGCTLVEYLHNGNLIGDVLFANDRNYTHTKTRFLGFDENMRIRIQVVVMVDWFDEQEQETKGGPVYHNLTLQRVGWSYKIAYSEGDI